jgi:inosose dehydratase
MNLKLGQCCISWGVEQPQDSEITPWEVYLDEAAASGYHGVELGPIGYLPTTTERLLDELDERGLELCAGYVMEPFATRNATQRTLTAARETAETLAALGAHHLVLIDDMYPERTAVAGQTERARRLDEDEFEGLVLTADAVAAIAVREFGLRVSFHPHAGSFVEFRDEIDRFLAAADPSLIGLCVDSGHSAYAGIDPVELFDAYSARVGYMHLKDVDRTTLQQVRSRELDFDHAIADGVFCPLGRGEVDYPALLRSMDAAGYDGWVSVEQDRLPRLESGKRRPFIEDARESFAYVLATGYTRQRGDANARRPDGGHP